MTYDLFAGIDLMKKTLLATALTLGFAGGAAAQTSVTLYGIVDAGFGHTQFKDNNLAATSARASAFATAITGRPAAVTSTVAKISRTGGHDGNQQYSRWGLRGTEDLGGGLRAAFQLESNFDLFTGTIHPSQGGRLFGRQAWLGLQSDTWGSLTFGRQENMASRHVAGVVGVYNDGFGEGHIGATFTSLRTVAYDNLIAYETPSFSGFKFGLGYSFNIDGPQQARVSGQSDTNQTALTTSLSYTNGPLAVALGYDRLAARDNVPDEKAIQSWALGASYDFDVVKLHLGFGQDINGVIARRDPSMAGFTVTAIDPLDTNIYNVHFAQDGHLGADYKTNNFALGLAVPVAAGQAVLLNVQSARLASGQYKDMVKTFEGKRSQNLYTVVYSYDLSPRTNLYAFGTYGTGYAFNDVNVTQAVVGLRHRF